MRPAMLGTALLAFALGAGAGATARAAPPPPPGGGNPVYHGGNNRAGYPAIPVTSVPPKPAPVVTGLALRASPNPFTRGMLISFRAAVGAGTTARIFSRDGTLVRRLDPRASGEGAWQAAWDGRDGRGRSVAPGLYFARVEAGGRTATLRIVRLK